MAGKKYPRPWCRLDREYLTQDTIRELGQRFGAAGPLVFLAIILEAGKAPSGGIVEMRYSAVAMLSHVTAEEATKVVAAAAEFGLLADLESDRQRFAARLTRWEAWEAKDPTSAHRSADYRGRQSADNAA